MHSVILVLLWQERGECKTEADGDQEEHRGKYSDVDEHEVDDQGEDADALVVGEIAQHPVVAVPVEGAGQCRQS